MNLSYIFAAFHSCRITQELFSNFSSKCAWQILTYVIPQKQPINFGGENTFSVMFTFYTT